MTEPLPPHLVREIVGVDLAEHDTAVLASTYASFARGVAAFPAADLKRVEPPLHSVPRPLK